MENHKEAPIESIIPLRILGLHRSKHFNYPISNSHVLYLSQFHLILQRLGDHSQHIIWSVPQPIQQNQIEIIAGETDIFQVTKVIIVLRNQRLLSKIVKVLMIDQNAGVIGQKQQQVRELDYYEQIKSVRYVAEMKMIIFLIQLKKSGMCKILLLSALDTSVRFRQQLLLMQKIQWIHPFQLEKHNFLMLVTKQDMQMLNLQNLEIIFCKKLQLAQSMKQGNNKAICLIQQKSQDQQNQRQVIVYSEINHSYKNNSIGILISNLGFAYSYQPNYNPQKIFFNKIDISLGRAQNHRSKKQNQSQIQIFSQQKKLHPIKSISSIANKAIFLYQRSNVIGYLTFSVHDCSKYTFKHKRIQTNCKQVTKQYDDIKFSNDQCHCCLVQTSKNKQSIIIIDVVSAFISRSQQIILKQQQLLKCVNFQYSVAKNNDKKQRKILLSQISLLSSFVFTVDKDHMLNAFKLTIEKGFMNPCWSINIYGQPYSLLCHPLMFKITLVFPQRFHCYSYNQENAIAFYQSSGTKFTCGCYSMLGNYLALGGYEFLALYDAYDLHIYRQQIIQMKTVTKIKFLNVRGDALIQANGNSLFLMYDAGPLINIGNLGSQLSRNPYTYDIFHKLLLYHDSNQGLLKIVNTKLETAGQLELPIKSDRVTSLFYCPQIQSILLGTQQGYIQVLQWGTKRINFQINLSSKLHSSAIIMISISVNFEYLIALSEEGALCVAKIKYVDCTKLKHNVSGNLLRKNQMKPYLSSFLMLLHQSITDKNQKINQLKLNLQQYNDTKTTQVQHQQTILAQQYKIQKQKYSLDKNKSQLFPKQYNEMVLSIRKQIINLPKLYEKYKAQAQQICNKQKRKIYMERQILQQQVRKCQQQKKQILLKEDQVNKQISKTIYMQFQTEYNQKVQKLKTVQNKQNYVRIVKQAQHVQAQNQQQIKVINYNTILLDLLNKQLIQLKQSNKNYANENRHLVVKNNFLWDKNRQASLRINDFQQQQKHILIQFNSIQGQKTLISGILQGKNESFKQLQYRTLHMEGRAQKIAEQIKNISYIHDYKYQEDQQLCKKLKYYQKLSTQLDQQFIQKIGNGKKLGEQLKDAKEMHKHLYLKRKNLKFLVFKQKSKLEIQNNTNQSSILGSPLNSSKGSSYFSNKSSPKVQQHSRAQSNCSNTELRCDHFLRQNDGVLQLLADKQKSVQKLIKSNNIRKAYRKQYELFIKKTSDQTSRLHDHLNRIRKQNLELGVKMKNLINKIKQIKQTEQKSPKQNCRATMRKQSIVLTGEKIQSEQKQRREIVRKTGHCLKGSNSLHKSTVFRKQTPLEIKKSRTLYKKQQINQQTSQKYKTPLSKYRKRNQLIKIKGKGSTYISVHLSTNSPNFSLSRENKNQYNIF